jgi:hypothetical protein
MRRRYHGLQDFFLGYFHPDWQLDAATRGEVVDAFLASADPDLVKLVISDLSDLLAEPLTEEELHGLILDEYSLFYDPWRENVSMRGWLEGLEHEIKRDELN